jgi:hypothetical protein
MAVTATWRAASTLVVASMAVVVSTVAGAAAVTADRRLPAGSPPSAAVSQGFTPMGL